MRALLDTSVLIGHEGPYEIEAAISAASLAELHFGVLVASGEDERARRVSRLGIVEATFDPLPIDAEVCREWDGWRPRSRVVAGSPGGAPSIWRSRPPPTCIAFR